MDDKKVIHSVIEAFKPHLGSTPKTVHRYEVVVTVSGVLKVIAESIHQALNAVIFKELTFTEDELFECCRLLLRARLQQVNALRLDMHPREWVYPTMFGPVLESVGIFRCIKDGYVIVPVLPAEFEEPSISLERYQEIMNILEIHGLYMARGLPMAKEVDNPNLYKMEECDAFLCGPTGDVPDPVSVFARVLLKMNYLAGVFGDARVIYTAISTMQNAIRAVVAQNIQGRKLTC
jgi:hypothetical protein